MSKVCVNDKNLLIIRYKYNYKTPINIIAFVYRSRSIVGLKLYNDFLIKSVCICNCFYNIISF